MVLRRCSDMQPVPDPSSTTTSASGRYVFPAIALQRLGLLEQTVPVEMGSLINSRMILKSGERIGILVFVACVPVKSHYEDVQIQALEIPPFCVVERLQLMKIHGCNVLVG